jgi:3',5'-cyclic AMP phosphodiesterase CpdA
MLRKKWLAIFLVLCITTAAVLAVFFAQRDVFHFADSHKNTPLDEITARHKLAPLEKIRGKFSFIVIGDNKDGYDIYSVLIKQAMEKKPDFIINTGDQIRHTGDLSGWKRFWELSTPVTVPYFITAGNHDEHHVKSAKMFREQAGMGTSKSYYSFSVDDALFIVLDSEIEGQKEEIEDEQYLWLRNLLDGSTNKHKFVVVHRPLYPDKGTGHHEGYSLDKFPKMRDRLQNLFVKNGVTAVFEGHVHLYSRKTINGVMHIITGGGGAQLYSDEKHGGFYHYIYVTVDGDKVVGEVVDINGMVRDRF